MTPDPREDLAEILAETGEYLAWLKDDGVKTLEVERGALVHSAPLPAPGKTDVRSGPLPACPAGAGDLSGQIPNPEAHPATPVSPPPSNPEGAPMDPELVKIAKTISTCKKCPLHEKRNKTVPGQGNSRRPEVMFIGEAPGADEDA